MLVRCHSWAHLNLASCAYFVDYFCMGTDSENVNILIVNSVSFDYLIDLYEYYGQLKL